jgi:hypothetical protein
MATGGHVAIRGAGGGLTLDELISIPDEKERIQRFRAANGAFYENVDWALDISKAEFESCRIFCELPVRLIRRDPETQVVVRREKLKETEAVWRASDDSLLMSDLELTVR